MKKGMILIGMSAICLSSLAQDPVSVARAEPIVWSPRVVYSPIITDSTLLLLSPNLVWRCAQDGYWGGGTLFEVDFEHVVSCEGRREVYELVRGHGDYYSYRCIIQDLRAKLMRTSDTTFLYTEMSPQDTTAIVRSVALVMDMSMVVNVDSLYTEDIQSGDMRLRVSKMVELKPK